MNIFVDDLRSSVAGPAESVGVYKGLSCSKIPVPFCLDAPLRLQEESLRSSVVREHCCTHATYCTG